MAAKPELSIVIPAYNEASRISSTLQEIKAYLDGPHPWRSAEVIVVCDGCTDNTEAVARAAGLSSLRVISYAPNRGKGHAVKTGVLASQGRIVLFSDADGSTPIAEAVVLGARLADGYDVAIGSRHVHGARITGAQPWRRRLLGRFFSLATRLVLGLDFADTQCGFKAFHGDVGRVLFRSVRCAGFAFDLELLVLARAHGLRVAEVGVEWRDRESSTVSPIRDGLRMLRTLWSLRGRPALPPVSTASAPATLPTR
jgi:dolichyl-phosphate beta-glucosyltransferase